MLASQGHAPAKREGLGLGGVDMPAELGGSTRAVDPTLFDARFKPLKTPRTRHAPSLSSPPSLAPFAASLKASAAPPPVPTSRMSVVGAAPPSAAAAAGAPTSASSKRTALKHLSGGLISYPMVARIDSTPTYTPPPEVPPIPTSVAAKVPPPPPPSGPPSSSSSSEPKKAGRGRPPPIKVGNAPGSSFLSPLKNRFGRAGKEKESAAAEAEEEAERSRSRTRRSKVDMLIAENNAAIKAAFPNVVAAAASEPSPEADLDITLPRKDPTSAQLSLDDTHLDRARTANEVEATGIALGSPFHDLTFLPTTGTAAAQTRPVHRRGTSDESPQIVQDAFARIADLHDERSRPSTMYSSRASVSNDSRRPSTVTAATSSVLKARDRAQSVQPPSRPPLAALAKVDDAFFPSAAAGPSTTSATTPAMSRRPSFAPRVLALTNSVGISVREGAATAPREVARAAFGSEGLTVSLRSYHRPEDLEVGWVCVPCMDDEGRSYTSWEIRLKPRTAGAAPAVPPLQASTSSLPEAGARARTPTGAATFLNYRMNAPPMPSSLDPSGMYPPTASASSSRRPSQHHSPTTPTSTVPPRKLSGRSEASSHGGSFSSDSSLATALGRKPKLSVSSVATTVPETLPPFDLEAIKHSCGFDDLSSDLFHPGAGAGHARTNRSSSYAPGSEGFPRARQFSIDEEGIMGRAASFSVGHGVAHRPKSPRHHRFGAYVPPVSQTGGAEFAQLAREVKRRSLAGGAIEGQEDDLTMPAGPTTPSPDRRVRKQSLATDGLPPPPPLPSLSLGDAEGAALPPTTKGFLAAARAGRRKQSIAPPAALVLKHSGGHDGGVVSPSSGKTVYQRSSLASAAAAAGPCRASDVFDLRTPTKAHQHYASTPPPTIPLPSLPGSGSGSDARPASTVSASSSDSSFGNRHEDDDSEVDPADVADVENASIRLVDQRTPSGAGVSAGGARRQVSRWSETDDDEDEGAGDSECQTSWCRVPDAVTTSDEGM